jgi:hypothetical protein
MLGALMEIFVFLLIMGLIFGAVGVAIASNKNVDGVAGFLLGAFLGPIGLIIVALLNPSRAATSSEANRDSQKEPDVDFVGERSFTSDAYRLWLADRYKIQRNDIFDRFVIKDQTFESLDAALSYAYDLEAARIESARLDKERLIAERAARLDAARIAAEGAAERAAADWEKNKPKIVLGSIISVAILIAFGALVYKKGLEIDTQSTKAVAELRAKIEREFGVKVPENAERVELEVVEGDDATTWCEGAINGKMVSFSSNSSPKEIAGSFTKQLGSGEQKYGSLFVKEENFSTIWKTKNASYVLSIIEFQPNNSVYLCVVEK